MSVPATNRGSGARGALRAALPPALLLIALLAAWEASARLSVLADLFQIRDFLIPAPTEVAEALWRDRSLLADDALVTLREVIGGFAIAIVAGIGFAVLIHLSETARRAVYPLLVASQTVPIIVVAPVLVVWFGFGIVPKLLIVALICFFPVTVNLLDGLRSVEPDLIKLMRTLGAGRLRILTTVELPSAAPFLFSGAKIAVAVAVIGAVFAEFAGSDAGLGHLMQLASSQLLTARLFAAIVVLSMIAITLFATLELIERRLLSHTQTKPTSEET